MIKKYVNVSVYNKEYTVVVKVDPKSGMFVGQCKQLPDALSQGKSIHELIGNLKEAIELIIECELDERKAKWEVLIEEAERLESTVEKNTLTMEEIVAEVKKARRERKD